MRVAICGLNKSAIFATPVTSAPVHGIAMSGVCRNSYAWRQRALAKIPPEKATARAGGERLTDG
jgi:hypothetical protein